MSPRIEEIAGTSVKTSAMRDDKVPFHGALTCTNTEAEASRAIAVRPPLSLRALPYLWITLRVKLTVFISLVRKLWSRASKQAAQGLLMSPQEEELGSEPSPWWEIATRTFPSELTLSLLSYVTGHAEKGSFWGYLYLFCLLQ